MGRTVGVSMTHRLAAAVVENNCVAGPILEYPDPESSEPDLHALHADAIVGCIQALVDRVSPGAEVDAVGLGIPGIVRAGVVEESPNFLQMKGLHIRATVQAALRKRHSRVSVAAANDADVMAAGIAALRGQLDRLIRVWSLGHGIGFGRYPSPEGVWEGGHMVVTLDPRESFCGCGGVGHLEGIMGHRAMRLRFLDLEPHEIFEQARAGDSRCFEFVKLWHRALAAGTASSVHMDGPGKFYLMGPSAAWVDTKLLMLFMSEMVKMSPLRGYAFEVVPGGDDIAIVGAAVHASL